MFVDRKLKHSLTEVVSELNGGAAPIDEEPIVAIEAHDKLFVGGGCEATPSVDQESAERKGYLAKHNERACQNMSVCVHGPEI